MRGVSNALQVFWIPYYQRDLSWLARGSSDGGTLANIGIHGLGRIGRSILRASLTTEHTVVAINDFTDDANLLYLTKYDSLHGRLPAPIEPAGSGWRLGDSYIARSAHAAIDVVPWARHGVDVVIDASGATSPRECRAVLDSGVNTVLVTRPESSADATIVAGYNEHLIADVGPRLISTSSCDANAAALVLAALSPLGISRGTMLTLHPWLGYQNLLDGPVENFPTDRRDDFALGRASNVNLIPKETSLLGALTDVLPALTPSLQSMSYRVPTSAVSCLNLNLDISGSTTADAVNGLLVAAADATDGPLRCETEALVSLDYLGTTAGVTVDRRWTAIAGAEAESALVRVVGWYDNETGYAHQVLRVAAAAVGSASPTTVDASPLALERVPSV